MLRLLCLSVVHPQQFCVVQIVRMAPVIFLSSSRLLFWSCVLISNGPVFAALVWLPFFTTSGSSEWKVPRNCYWRLVAWFLLLCFALHQPLLGRQHQTSHVAWMKGTLPSSVVPVAGHLLSIGPFLGTGNWFCFFFLPDLL